MAAPDPRSVSPWWALLLLPAGLAAGLAVGQIPSRPPGAAVTPPADPSPNIGGTAGGTRARGWDPAVARVDNAARATEGVETSTWTTLDAAMAESERNGKPIMIDFNAEWCGPCQMLKHEVFEDAGNAPRVQTAVIPVSIVDRQREDGSNPPETQTLQARYQIDAFPTLIVFSPKTGRVQRARGFGGADRTVAWILSAAEQVR
jgi:thiol:disulfide interchange protein